MKQQRLSSWVLESLELNKEMKVLDVAAGTGILSRAISPFVKEVTSIDVSEDMIQEGIKENKNLGIENVHFHIGNVEHLPFTPREFDLVFSRFAFHHFIKPVVILGEMVRVCKEGGNVCVVDMISPEEGVLYQSYNHYERLRDPSHTYALKASHLIDMFTTTELKNITTEIISVDVNVQKWLKLTKTEHKIGEEIIVKLNEEILKNEKVTGMFPFVKDNEMMFKQKWLKIVGSR
ncbi:class I SAM-dependent methyltransferase [Chengkuizengella axinellae]|uniref:Class I SAM-dependent methyltransferase n=1 Tax=Chengkuizengella axinellae TaxID=3064388 RepID=A0ABT9IU71_9BACL|nr:class I SAM-dependent methyltransferase [Chengkuizengella sp. 2205SS18-9]MDP5272885.1 class I SAM-dependent methyltransferase [Chengkuizengella sp. 2205SS18-9]